MRLSARFKRLTLWNKLGVIGSLASIISIPLSAVVFVAGLRLSVNKVNSPQTDFETQQSSAVNRVTEGEAALSAAVSLLVTKHDLTQQDISYINGLLERVSVDDLESLIDGIPQPIERRSLERTVASQQIVNEAKLNGLNWNGTPMLVRFLRLADDSLDLMHTSFYAEQGPYSEQTKPLNLNLPYDVHIHVCEVQMASRHILELLIIRPTTV